MVDKRVVKEMAKTKEMPLGIKILAVLAYIGAALTLLMGILLIIGASFAQNIVNSLGGQGVFSAVLGASLVLAAIMILLVAVLSFYVGRGLFKGQNWARIVVGIFAGLGALGALVSLFSGAWGNIVPLIIDGSIAYYLFFAKEVKAAFS